MEKTAGRSTDEYVRTVLVQPLQKSGVVRDEDHCKARAHTRERQGGRVYLHQNDGGGAGLLTVR